ncbi:hypothetical protein BOX15_Mlig017137g2 [Macrostomum lignano]|uniref:Histone-lysine N-methyltransferase n=1 Tax=Macrostomum lignano TaxID=282301 RepID=A0A267DVF4_9PLAT|nr:hypothetical protein BOX15_Mlig017137g2 [Macrostomum lignano]
MPQLIQLAIPNCYPPQESKAAPVRVDQPKQQPVAATVGAAVGGKPASKTGSSADANAAFKQLTDFFGMLTNFTKQMQSQVAMQQRELSRLRASDSGPTTAAVSVVPTTPPGRPPPAPRPDDTAGGGCSSDMSVASSTSPMRGDGGGGASDRSINEVELDEQDRQSLLAGCLSSDVAEPEEPHDDTLDSSAAAEAAAKRAAAAAALEPLEPAAPPGMSPPSYELLQRSVPLAKFLPTEPACGWPCDCSVPTPDQAARGAEACGSDCVNRALRVECDNRRCPCGEMCTNRRFDLPPSALPLEPLYLGARRDWGVRATSSVGAGAFLIEFAGELVDWSEFWQRRAADKAAGKRLYFMPMGASLVADATANGNLARFVSCSGSAGVEANTEAQVWVTGGQRRLGLFARRDIARGEELVIDCRFLSWPAAVGAETRCSCCGKPSMTLDFGHDASQLLTLETVTQPNEVISLLRALLHQRDLPIEARTRLLQLLADAAGPAVADCLLTLRRHHGLQLTAACLTEAAPNCCSNSSSSPNTQLVLAALRTMARVPLASADQLARASVADSLQQLLRRLSGDRDAVGQLAAELLARWDRLPNETAAPGSGAAATASSTASTQAAAPDASLALTSTTPQPTADSCAAAEEFDRLFEAYAGMTEPDRKQLQAAALAGSSGGVHAILCRVLEAMLLRGGSGGGGFHARSAAMAGCVSQEDLADAAAADPNVHRLLLAVTQRGDAAVAASGGLPPQWRSARDPDGRVYFYHLGTRRTVWRDQPGSEHSWEPTYPWDALPEETAAEPSAAASEAAFEYNGAWRFQVSHDEIQDMITRNAVKIRRRERVEKVEQRRREVASSRELQQKAAFTASMKEFVHAHLQRYCAATCQTGRITNQEDLKYLVKKMTHAILLKELKHTRHIEDLEVNANVQGKAKSYISKYMRSKGSVYCRTGRPSASGHGGPTLQ